MRMCPAPLAVAPLVFLLAAALPLSPAAVEVAYASAPVANVQCGALSEAMDVDTLRMLLQTPPPFVFFDIDETLVMPDTPFIYGLPRNDAFVSALDACESKAFKDVVSGDMEAMYYSTPEKLVHADLPALIRGLRSGGVVVYGLTSRKNTDDPTHRTQNEKLVRALVDLGVQFSPLPNSLRGPGDALDGAGGVFWAGSEKADKGAMIARVVPKGTAATLVDNTLAKLETALRNQDLACLHGVHFMAAYTQEHSSRAMRRWFCDDLELHNRQCPRCNP